MLKNYKHIKLIITLIVISVFLLLLSIYTTNARKSNFESLMGDIKEELLNEKKADIKLRVQNLNNLINTHNTFSLKYLKETIKQRVDNAYTIASNIYKKNAKIKSKHEIIAMIRETLRPIRYDDGTGYIFMASMGGVDILFPVMPSIEDTNVYNLQDSKGDFVVQDEIKLLQNDDEGYLEDFWTKPGAKENSMTFKKVTFIKIFKELNLYIGTGMYMDSASEHTKKHIVYMINHLNIQNPRDYYMVSKFIKLPNSKNVSKVVIHPYEVVGSIEGDKNALCLKNLSIKGETFESYEQTNPLSLEDEEKVSYYLLNDDWKWILSTGFYMQEIDAHVLKIRKRLEDKLTQEINKQNIIFSLVGAFLLLLVFMLNKAKRSENNINF